MGERKVLNKYYPPDFDPAKLPRGKRPDHNSMKVRMMLPMSVQCKTCGTFMYKGTKFNMKKEDAANETYLGIQIFRFYWRCSACAAEITMKTDPQNSDYNMELGATRNYEPWREKEQVTALNKAQREEEERGNAMKALENRTLDSKREMDIMTALDELQSLSARHSHVTADQALAAIKRSAPGVPEDEPLALEDEELIRQMLAQGRSRRLEDEPQDGSGASASGPGRPAGQSMGSAAATAPSTTAVDHSAGTGTQPAQTNGLSAPAKKPGAFGMQPRGMQLVVQKRPRQPETAATAKQDTVRRRVDAPVHSPAANAGDTAEKQAGSEGTGGLLGLGGYDSGSGSGSP